MAAGNHRIAVGDTMQDITLEEWDKAEKRLSNGTSADPNGISIKLVKLLDPRTKKQLRNSINSILQGGEVPDTWKLS